MSALCTNDLQLVPCRRGGVSLQVTGRDGRIRALHSLYDPWREAVSIADACSFKGQGFLVVLGLGLGYHVAEMARRFPGADILVVEGMPEIHEAAKRSGVLDGSAERVVFLVGLPPKEALRRITRYQLVSGMRPLFVLSLSSALCIFAEYYDPIVAALEKATTVKLWDRLKYGKFRTEQVRVLLIDFEYFLTREVHRAVRSSGHQAVSVRVREGERGEEIVSRLIDTILELKPDFLLTINHLGFDEEGVLTSFLAAIEMPVASWYVDSPKLIVKDYGRNVSPYTRVFLWDRGYIQDMQRMGFEEVSYLPLGSDTELFRPVSRGHSKVARHKAPVSFVGHSMVERVHKWASRLDEEARSLVESLARQMLATRSFFPVVLRSAQAPERRIYERLSPRDRTNLEAAVLARSTLLYRLSCLQALAPFQARVYGDEGWQGLLDERYTLLPPVDYYRDLRFVYNACKINFNATNLQMGAAVNQRVFDVPACGAFLLTDRQEALDELFEVGREMIAFRDPDEIPELADYYLRHPEARREIAARGRKRVLSEHTYRHRFKTIVQIMKASYGR